MPILDRYGMYTPYWLKIDSDLNREHQGVAYEPRAIGTNHSLDIGLHAEPRRRSVHVIQLQHRLVRHRRLMVHPFRFAQVAGELAEDREQAESVLTARGQRTLVQQTRVGKIFDGVYVRRRIGESKQSRQAALCSRFRVEQSLLRQAIHHPCSSDLVRHKLSQRLRVIEAAELESSGVVPVEQVLRRVSKFLEKRDS